MFSGNSFSADPLSSLSSTGLLYERAVLEFLGVNSSSFSAQFEPACFTPENLVASTASAAKFSPLSELKLSLLALDSAASNFTADSHVNDFAVITNSKTRFGYLSFAKESADASVLATGNFDVNSALEEASSIFAVSASASVQFEGVINEASGISDLATGFFVPLVVVTDSASTSESTEAELVFACITAEQLTALEAESTQVDFLSDVAESNKIVLKVVANADVNSAVVETVQISDEALAKFLWEQIATGTSTMWTTIKTRI